jgi:hypothetical protein
MLARISLWRGHLEDVANGTEGAEVRGASVPSATSVPSIKDAEYALIHSGASTGKLVQPGEYSKGTTYLLKGKRDVVQHTDWTILSKNGGAGQLSLCLTDIHLAIKMIEIGLDYNTGALGYLKYISSL